MISAKFDEVKINLTDDFIDLSIDDEIDYLLSSSRYLKNLGDEMKKELENTLVTVNNLMTDMEKNFLVEISTFLKSVEAIYKKKSDFKTKVNFMFCHEFGRNQCKFYTDNAEVKLIYSFIDELPIDNLEIFPIKIDSIQYHYDLLCSYSFSV